VSDFDESFDEALNIGCAPDDLDLRHPELLVGLARREGEERGFARPQKAQRRRPSNSPDLPAPSAGDRGSAERGDQIRKLLLKTKRGSPLVGGEGGMSAA
jgi:hypothetical protein